MAVSSNFSFSDNQIKQAQLIGQVITSMLNPETFKQQMVQTLKDGFGFYHVAIYRLDESGQWAVIQEAAGAASQAMIQAGYRLALDDQSAVGWAGQNRQACAVQPVDNSWLPESQSELALPLCLGDQVIGVLNIHSVVENAFDPENLSSLQTLADQFALAIDKLNDIENSLRETHLMLDLSRRLSAALHLKDVYTILTRGVISTGAERCTLHLCDDFSSGNLPRRSEVVAVSDVNADLSGKGVGHSLVLTNYPVLEDLVYTQETLIISEIASDERLTAAEQALLQKFGGQSVVVNPLVSRHRIIGLLFIEYRSPHNFSERELALYRTLCNQATIAIEHARQIQRTELALAETQTLYRAGRVLAGAADLQAILQQALTEFVYSLGLDQGGITLISYDRKYGQLMAYLQDGQLQNVEKLRFPLDTSKPYQQILLSGQPFVSIDAPNDPKLEGFISFNQVGIPKSLLQAPMIIHGETIGWIGADSVKEHRYFSQQEVDLARAMADQIAITIQNRRLLEQTERRAEQLKAVAKVGESVSRTLDLKEILNSTVDLIRDRFGFYHVSIFLLDEAREWAVVHASTGEVGRIMVERPHRLQVGGSSIVGFVTAQAQPRIALDVGEDAVHFKNPLLPDTRSEMALPLISRGVVIGALDVQSKEVNAFSGEDVETLQIMADQVATAIENARLFEQTQRRLLEQATLYNIGTKIGSTLNLKEATDNLVAETAAALNAAECILTLIEDNEVGYIISDYVAPDSPFVSNEGLRFELKRAADVVTVLTTKQEYSAHIDDPTAGGMAFEYLKRCQGTALVMVPVLLGGEVAALLEVYDHTPNRHFSGEDITLLNSIALQAANAIANARLYQNAQDSQKFLQAALARTQSLYRISDALATTTAPQSTAEIVLGEYLSLLKLKHGALLFLDRMGHYYEAQALYVEGQPVKPELILPAEEDAIIRHLSTELAPLIISDVDAHPLTQNRRPAYLSEARTILAVPLVMQDKVIGTLTAGSSAVEHIFLPSEIEIGAAVADQLTIWLENRRLLGETQHRSNLLQTAAEVSRAASSILDVNELINTSVNLIRDQFNFYYVGLFLVDEAREWAVLQAGTGEAGRIQLEKKHRLKIGGESMIGWCIHNRQARIALDVGQEAVHFQNPYLPETHSEMALPLISRDEVIGALTVQSTERSAFSAEDVTLLQTMADQLANAIENARLFAQTQKALSETEALYQITQELSAAHDEESVYRLAIEAISHTEVGAAAIYMYLGQQAGHLAGQVLEQKAAWPGESISPWPHHIHLHKADSWVEQFGSQQGDLISEDMTRDNLPLTASLRQQLIQAGARSLAALPLATHQSRLGFLLITKSKEGPFTPQQLRFFDTISRQMVIALENLRLLNVSQQRARREEIIREISSKIRGATTVEDILKTTVTELGQVLGASRGGITLNVNLPPAKADLQTGHRTRPHSSHRRLKGGQNGQ